MKHSVFKFITGLLLTTTVSASVEAKTLVAYFTLTGNTENAAKKIQEQTGSDLYKIELVTPYPNAYREQTKLAKEQLASGYLPPIKPMPENIDEYDVVFVGSPVWWGTMATPVRTFLSSGVLADKTVIPFVTHGGGGADASFTDTAKLCQDCTVITDGWSGYGSMTLGLSGWVDQTLQKLKQ